MLTVQRVVSHPYYPQNIPIHHHMLYLGGLVAMVTLHHCYSLSVSLHC